MTLADTAWVAFLGALAGCASTTSESRGAARATAFERPTPESQDSLDPEPAATDARPRTEPARDRLRITAAGDVMFGRYRDKVYRPTGGDAPFEYVASRWRDSDLVFVNLETPLMDGMPERFERGEWDRRNLSFRADTRYADVLKRAGIGVVSLANNHAEDCRMPGIESTIQALDRVGIVHFGTSVSGDSYAPRILEYDGVTIVFMGLTLHRNIGELKQGERPPVAYLPRKLAKLWVPERVAAVRAEHPDALIIFSFHWGMEYEHLPYYGIRKLAESAIDSGADLVLGHHPHVLQPVQAHGDGLILYSTGNLIFDMIRAQPQQSALFHIDLLRDDDGRFRPRELRVEAIKVRPRDGARAPTRALGQTILRDLATWSRKLRTTLEREGDELVWRRDPRVATSE